MMFRDRSDAGRRLAKKLAHLKDRKPVVLALPRGGVPVGVEVARARGAPLDLVLVRKIGVPWQPELALGAVTDGAQPETFIDRELAAALQISEDYVKEENGAPARGTGAAAPRLLRRPGAARRCRAYRDRRR